MKQKILEKFAENLFQNNTKTKKSLEDFAESIKEKATELGFDMDMLEFDGEYLELNNGVYEVSASGVEKSIYSIYGWQMDEPNYIYYLTWK